MPHRLSLRPNGKHRKQRGKDYSVTINGLLTHRSLLLTEKPDTVTTDIAAIDYVLNLVGFNEDPQPYMPKFRKRSIFAKGEKLKLIREVLEQAERPLTSREVCITALTGKDFDMNDTRRLNQTVTGVYLVLVAECERGRVDKVEGFPTKWLKPLSASSL